MRGLAPLASCQIFNLHTVGCAMLCHLHKSNLLDSLSTTRRVIHSNHTFRRQVHLQQISNPCSMMPYAIALTGLCFSNASEFCFLLYNMPSPFLCSMVPNVVVDVCHSACGTVYRRQFPKWVSNNRLRTCVCEYLCVTLESKLLQILQRWSNTVMEESTYFDQFHDRLMLSM